MRYVLFECTSPHDELKTKLIDQRRIFTSGRDLGTTQLRIGSRTHDRCGSIQIHRGTTLPDTEEDEWLDTGDLGFFDSGQLFVRGRSKDIIIIGGENHSPYPLELSASEFVGLKIGTSRKVECAAFPVDSSVHLAIEVEHSMKLGRLEPFQAGITANSRVRPVKTTPWRVTTRVQENIFLIRTTTMHTIQRGIST